MEPNDFTNFDFDIPPEGQKVEEKSAAKPAKSTDLSRYMTRRKRDKIRAQYENEIKERQKAMEDRRKHAKRFNYVSFGAMVSLGVGLMMMMQSSSEDLNFLGTQISIGSVTALLLIHIFLVAK